MQELSKRPIIIWLFTGCFFIFSMVVIGGVTRLTNSGLSMVEWNLLMGSLPPMNETEWMVVFEKYKQFPEYQLINSHFTLEEFKDIFFWEYLHRLLGRVVGLVFIIPFIYFLAKKMISRKLFFQLLLLLFMGGFQGFLGWYMVKSGLNKDPDVSHYRLAMHLITAFITFAYTFWVALGLIYPNREKRVNHPLKNSAFFLLGITIVQIVWGAFVAGLNAGKIYNTWPKMGEQWIADSVTAIQPLWHNFVEGLGGVQFVHRYLAYIVVATVLWLVVKSRKMLLDKSQSIGLKILLGTVLFQFVLGVITLLMAVPVWLGVMHQLGAFFLLGSTVYVVHRFNFATVMH
ncbi:COX15/CtaA family protein [Acidiluteibacter ferrifornacis]|uniref:Heme A synthase n=1 Tax=Acidiluteibacter ferrifornacis TaxID=2692424 RepID=A0A6N9NDN4_9FLAO|nr:COX15/CtaA family protein [Acidiluteibacter ferrifornacis]NBG64706.1 heme A synthase [Acidiluteibacter ferrifornacis]